ncbi:Protein CAT-2 [Aphelenchoides avenae]|nr:Protein CAT-2 [Aphelenchus avenae]
MSVFPRHTISGSVDRVQNEGLKRQNTLRKRRELEKSSLSRQLLQKVNDDGIELIKEANDRQHLGLALVINSGDDSRNVIVAAVQRLVACGIHISHIETRPDAGHPSELELFVQCEGQKPMFIDALTKLIIEKPVDRIEVRRSDEADALKTTAWFPRHVSELDQCAHVVVKYEPTEDPKHPGYGDPVYITRRAELNRIANSYRFGDQMAHVEYTQEEHNTWRMAYLQLKELRATHTCIEYQRNVAAMEAAGVITAEKIPQLKDLNAYIQQRTGFELRPCGGLLSARDFLASLAFRVFQATLYVRHSSAPHHCPEPDVIHEILGHCPMFADPEMAQMSQEIGLVSLGATDEEIERLSTVYWFIIEFGLCRLDGQLRAIGAGLISAYGELQHACSDVPEHEPFVPEITAVRQYEDSDYQPVYFVAESIRDAMDRLRAYARSLKRSAVCIYDPLRRAVEPVPKDELVRRKVHDLEQSVATVKELMEDLRVKKLDSIPQ